MRHTQLSYKTEINTESTTAQPILILKANTTVQNRDKSKANTKAVKTPQYHTKLNPKRKPNSTT